MRAPDFWQRDGVGPRLLEPIGWAIAGVGMMRRRLARPFIVPMPVVCVGNLTVGGSGKTPVVLALARWLTGRGTRIHCLTRGYGGALAGPLVVDGAVGFGNGRLLPAGPLREPIDAGLARADAVVLVGADAAGVRARIGTALPIIPARLTPHDAWDGLRGRRVVAFAGIGRPEKFFDMLAAHGITVVERLGFADHHRYDDADLQRLDAAATRAGAALVTTAKDAVRLPAAFRARITVLGVTLAWDDPTTPERLLAPLLTQR